MSEEHVKVGSKIIDQDGHIGEIKSFVNSSAIVLFGDGRLEECNLEDLEVVEQSKASGKITEQLYYSGNPCYHDVGRFHQKMGLSFHDGSGTPRFMDAETAEFRVRFIKEELKEFESALESGDMAGQADALIDMVFVIMGTAHLMNLPWGELWNEVVRANMAKERATGDDDPRSVRKSRLDVVKPEGWTPPDIESVLKKYGWST